MADEKRILSRGARSAAIGADAKVTPTGKCNHPNKREFRREYNDGLPIPQSAWPHCVFCRSGECCFAGECEHREGYKTLIGAKGEQDGK